MTDRDLDRFARSAANHAMRAAAKYLQAIDVHVTDYESATDILRRHVKERLPEALDDAREGFECGMHTIAERTFYASMSQAGIAGAKEIAGIPAA